MKTTLGFLVAGALLAVACGNSGDETEPGSTGTGGGGSGSGGAGGAGGVGGTTGVGGSDHACVGTTCAASEVCIAYRTVGGGLVEPDANGDCPDGSHPEPVAGSEYCVADFAYQCVELVGCSGTTPVTCACAQPRGGDGMGTCPMVYSACADPQPDTSWLDPVAQLICEQQAP
jgi:hypothetical protein